MPASWAYTVTTPPAELPLTIAELRAHLRALSQREDAYLADLLRAAAEATERYTGRAWVGRTIAVKFDTLAGELLLPCAPLRAVNSVQYVDPYGSTQTLSPSGYAVDLVDAPGKPGSILPAWNTSWPSCRGFRGDVTISADVGYGDASAVPEPVRQALRVTCAALNIDREGAGASLPMAARDLLWPYVVRPVEVCA